MVKCGGNDTKSESPENVVFKYSGAPGPVGAEEQGPFPGFQTCFLPPSAGNLLITYSA